MVKGWVPISVREGVKQRLERIYNSDTKRPPNLKFTAYVENMLQGIIDNYERVREYGQFLEVLSFSDSHVLLDDHYQNGRFFVELSTRPEAMVFCQEEASTICMHVGYCLALPEVHRALINKGFTPSKYVSMRKNLEYAEHLKKGPVQMPFQTQFQDRTKYADSILKKLEEHGYIRKESGTSEKMWYLTEAGQANVSEWIKGTGETEKIDRPVSEINLGKKSDEKKERDLGTLIHPDVFNSLVNLGYVVKEQGTSVDRWYFVDPNKTNRSTRSIGGPVDELYKELEKDNIEPVRSELNDLKAVLNAGVQKGYIEKAGPSQYRLYFSHSRELKGNERAKAIEEHEKRVKNQVVESDA